jgi:large subunit ribosomal protein L10
MDLIIGLPRIEVEEISLLLVLVLGRKDFCFIKEVIMKRQEKVEIVKDLGESLARSQSGVVTSYQGLPTPELVNLRHKLKEAGVEFRVVKNTLARLAVAGTEKEFMASHLDGALALALGYSDVTAPARAIMDYIRSANLNMKVQGGFLSDRWLSLDEVTSLSTMPTREVLLGKVLAGMQSPIYGLVNSLTSPMLGMVWVLQARIKQMEAN